MTERILSADALRLHAARCMSAGAYADAIYDLRRFLSAPDNVWPDVRCEGMLLLAQCHLREHNRTEAERWLLRACAEAPELPQPWLEAAAFYTAAYPQAAAFCAARAGSTPESRV